MIGRVMAGEARACKRPKTWDADCEGLSQRELVTSEVSRVHQYCGLQQVWRIRVISTCSARRAARCFSAMHSCDSAVREVGFVGNDDFSKLKYAMEQTITNRDLLPMKRMPRDVQEVLWPGPSSTLVCRFFLTGAGVVGH